MAEHEWSKDCYCKICQRATDSVVGYSFAERRSRYAEIMDAKVPIAQYVENAMEMLKQAYPDEQPEQQAYPDKCTLGQIEQDSNARSVQENRVQALLDVAETDWDAYEREVGILLEMMPVEQPTAVPKRSRSSAIWFDTILFVTGLSGVLWASFPGHADPTLLMVFVSMMGMPAFLRMAPSSDKL